jgi:quercetin dioxygenase-like cupin family protein
MGAFSDLRAIAPQQLRPGLSARAIHGEEMTLAVNELDSGVGLPEHTHANEQAGVLIEGSLTFRIGDEEQELHSGETWLVASNVPHSVVAGSDGAIFVEVFSPPRHEWQSLEADVVRPTRWPLG